MSQVTYTKDLWSIAEKEINSIKPEKTVALESPQNNFLTRKNIDDIYRSSAATIQKIMPKNNIKSISTNQNVPDSVKVLDMYAQKIGFMPMGSVYEKKGNSFIGRTEEITEKGEKFYLPFPELTETFYDTPNLTQNLSFRANKAIEKWNEFVSAEAELAEFLEKTKTEEGRHNLIIEFAKSSSIFSDYLKVLSSLYFYYVEKASPNTNILQLTPDSAKKLVEVLTKSGPLDRSYEFAMKIIDDSPEKDSRMVRKVKQYHKYKYESLRTTLTVEEFQQIQPLLDEEKAYVPNEMISTPMVQQSEWFKVLKKEGLRGNIQDSKLVITEWNPKEKWFRAINYFK